MSELQDKQSLGDGLDPGADQGQSLASDISAKIADGESAAKLMELPIWFDRRPHGCDGFQGLLAASDADRLVDGAYRCYCCAGGLNTSRSRPSAQFDFG
jgi:hypothetical protein